MSEKGCYWKGVCCLVFQRKVWTFGKNTPQQYNSFHSHFIISLINFSSPGASSHNTHTNRFKSIHIVNHSYLSPSKNEHEKRGNLPSLRSNWHSECFQKITGEYLKVSIHDYDQHIFTLTFDFNNSNTPEVVITQFQFSQYRKI